MRQNAHIYISVSKSSRERSPEPSYGRVRVIPKYCDQSVACGKRHQCCDLIVLRTSCKHRPRYVYLYCILSYFRVC